MSNKTYILRKLSKTQKEEVLNIILNKKSITTLLNYCNKLHIDTTMEISPLQIDKNNNVIIRYRNKTTNYSI